MSIILLLSVIESDCKGTSIIFHPSSTPSPFPSPTFCVPNKPICVVFRCIFLCLLWMQREVMIASSLWLVDAFPLGSCVRYQLVYAVWSVELTWPCIKQSNLAAKYQLFLYAFLHAQVMFSHLFNDYLDPIVRIMRVSSLLTEGDTIFLIFWSQSCVVGGVVHYFLLC